MTDRTVTVRLRGDIADFQRKWAAAGTSTSAFVKRLEAADSRMANLVQTALALTPALVPIGAAGVPALAGLTTQLGFAAVAGGTTMLAFQGVGDALGALNKFQVEPTSKNLEDLNKKLDALGPAGEVFVRQLQEMRSEFQVLQDVAQQNMFPGLNDGIESLMTQMPRLEDVIASVSTTLGNLFADAGADLAGPEWSEFFEYLDREAGPILEQTGKTVGNLVEGITNMVMAFDPLSDDFVTGMLEMSESFVAWSDGLDSSQGFQNFVRYVQESGPQALDTLGAIASMLVEFAQAAAPVGDAVLPVLEALADVLGKVADSPAGPVIIGAAAAIGVLGRSLALLSAVGLRGGGSDTLLAKVLGTEKMSSSVKTLREANAATRDLTLAQRASAMAATAQDKAVRSGLAQMGKTAAAAGGLAIMTSGVADGMGLSNTASMALMGTLAGPWGAAVGGGVGLLMDMKDASNEAEASVDRLNAAADNFDPTGLQEMAASVVAIRKQVTDAYDVTGSKDFFSDVAKANFGPDPAKMQADADAVEEQAERITIAFANVAMALGEDFKDEAGRSMRPTIDELTLAADRALPAMQALGITAEDLASMDYDELVVASDAIAAWTAHADTAAGRTKAVAAAMRELDNDMIDTATSAEILEGALDGLLGPGLNLSAATDAWRDGLRNLNEELDRNKGSLFDNTDAASQNRSVIRDRVGDLQAILVAEANAGASAGDLSKMLRNQRKALLDAGEAAGIARPQLNNYLNDLGLTPKMVKTIMKLEVAEAENRAENLRERLDKLNAMKPSPKVDAKTAAAEAALAKVEAYLARIDGTSANATVTTTFRQVGATTLGPRPEAADGGTVPKTGLPYADRHPYLLADGEEVISNRNGQADRNRPLLKAINAGRMADGGTAGEKARERRDRERREAEERRRRAEEKRQRQLDKQEKKALLASDLDDDGQQANLSVRDARRRLRSAREANRPKSEMLDLRLGLKQARGDREDVRADERADREDKRLEREEAALTEYLERQEKAAETALLAAEDQLDAAEKNQASAQATLDATKQLRDSLKADVAGQFKGSLTGGGLAGLMRTLNKDVAGGSAMSATLQALKDAGLDTTGAAAGLFQELAASNDLTTANELLAGGQGAIDAAEQAFVQRDQINTARGEFVAEASYGQMIAQQTATLEVAQQQVAVAEAARAAMEAQLAQVHADLQNVSATVAQVGPQVGAALNSVSASSVRGSGWGTVGSWR